MNIVHMSRTAGALLALSSAFAIGSSGFVDVAAATASSHRDGIILASGQPPTAGTALRRPCKAGIWVSGCRNKPPPPISDAARDCYKTCKSDGSSTAACQKSCL